MKKKYDKDLMSLSKYGRRKKRQELDEAASRLARAKSDNDENTYNDRYFQDVKYSRNHPNEILDQRLSNNKQFTEQEKESNQVFMNSEMLSNNINISDIREYEIFKSKNFRQDHPSNILLNNKKTNRQKFKLRTIILSILAVVLLFICIIAGLIGRSLLKLKTIHLPTVSYNGMINSGDSNTDPKIIYINSDFPLNEVTQADPNVRNILIFGTDTTDPDDVGRSDAIIVLSLNQNSGDIRLTSILRDTEVYTEAYGNIKINATYAYGGVNLLINAINDNFDLDIQEFIKVDLWSSVDLVDALGGVDIEIRDEDELFYTNDILRQMRQLHPDKEIPDIDGVGVKHLSGSQAVAYSRNRNSDSDFGRTGRQRIVLEAMMNKLKSFSLSTKISFFDTLCSELVTNISKSELLKLALGSTPLLLKPVQTYHVPESGMYYDDTSTYNLIVDYDQQVPALHDFIWSR